MMLCKETLKMYGYVSKGNNSVLEVSVFVSLLAGSRKEKINIQLKFSALKKWQLNPAVDTFPSEITLVSHISEFIPKEKNLLLKRNNSFFLSSETTF